MIINLTFDLLAVRVSHTVQPRPCLLAMKAAAIAAFAFLATTLATGKCKPRQTNCIHALLDIVCYYVYIVIHLENREGVSAVCKGTEVVTQCTTTTNNGYLLWRNRSGSGFRFDDFSSVNTTGTLGSMKMILDRIEPVGSAFVYTSTATDIVMEEMNFTCSDGEDTERIDISANSKLAEKSCFLNS